MDRQADRDRQRQMEGGKRTNFSHIDLEQARTYKPLNNEKKETTTTTNTQSITDHKEKNAKRSKDTTSLEPVAGLQARALFTLDQWSVGNWWI